MALDLKGEFPIFLARHGETTFNVERRWQGAANDSPLTERGRAQARETGLILRDLIDLSNPPHFVASPLGRARATMEIALEAMGLPRDVYTTDPRLVEIDLGQWTGMLADEVKERDATRWQARQADRWNVPCPGGENFCMAAERAQTWIGGLDRATAAISHGVFGRILRVLYAGLPWEQIAALDEPQGCVFRLHEGAIARFDSARAVPPEV